MVRSYALVPKPRDWRTGPRRTEGGAHATGSRRKSTDGVRYTRARYYAPGRAAGRCAADLGPLRRAILSDNGPGWRGAPAPHRLGYRA